MSEYEIVPVGSRASAEDYVRLFSRCYGENDKLTVPYIRWLYADNPHGNAVGMDAYLGDELAAHYVTIPRRYHGGGEVVELLLSVNTATDPDHQRRGLFKTLANATYAHGAELGYGYVIGVANAQSIHAFKTSLGFETLGQVRLAVGRRPPVLTTGKPRLAMDAEWLGWRLTNPSARYFTSPVGGGEVAINTRRGRATFSLGRVPGGAVAGIGGLERRSWCGPLPLSPVFPSAGKRPLLPAWIIPSPWHVILRRLAAPSTTPMREVQFDGLSMDTF